MTDPEDTSPRRGRPPGGKRSDPAYKTYAFYLRQETMDAVKVALLRGKTHPDASELMEELLTHWLARQSPETP